MHFGHKHVETQNQSNLLILEILHALKASFYYPGKRKR